MEGGAPTEPRSPITEPPASSQGSQPMQDTDSQSSSSSSSSSQDSGHKHQSSRRHSSSSSSSSKDRSHQSRNGTSSSKKPDTNSTHTDTQNGSSSSSTSTSKIDELKEHKGEFVCSSRYRAINPELPFDTKTLKYPYEPARHVPFQMTQMEKDMPFEIYSDIFVAAPVDLVDPHAYSDCANESDHPYLDPRDMLLLPSVSLKTMAAPKAPKPEGSYKSSTADVIYGVDFRPDLSVTMSNVNKGGRYVQNITTDQIVDTIEETFQAAQNTPSHPTRPDLTATEVYPVLPGLDFLCNFYALVKFREAPESVIDLDDDVSAAEKTLLIANSIASCSTSEKAQNALDCSLLVPNIDFTTVDLETFLEEPDQKREYVLAAHFDFTEKEIAQKDNLFLAIDKDLRVATFNKIGTVYNARLRSKQDEQEIYHLNPTHIDPESLALLEKLRADYEDPPVPTEDVEL